MLYEAREVKILALELMFIASRGWLRAPEARIQIMSTDLSLVGSFALPC